MCVFLLYLLYFNFSSYKMKNKICNPGLGNICFHHTESNFIYKFSSFISAAQYNFSKILSQISGKKSHWLLTFSDNQNPNKTLTTIVNVTPVIFTLKPYKYAASESSIKFIFDLLPKAACFNFILDLSHLNNI